MHRAQEEWGSREGSPADRVLVEGLRRGDERCYELLLERHGGRMLATARRFSRHEDEALDVFQAALLQVVRSIGGFRGESSLGTWLHRVVVNEALMRLRSRSRRPELSVEPEALVEGGRLDVRGSGVPADAERGLLEGELRHRVRECIRRLPERYRRVVILRDIQELDTSQTALALGISTNAVKVRLYRARRALGPLLREEFVG